MATNYPGGLDSLTNPSSGDALTSPSHAGQHANANDAIEAIETELGTDPSGSAATVKARLDAIETGARLGTNSVGATQLADSAVDTAAIADSAVTSAKIADGTIATADLADGAVTPEKIMDGGLLRYLPDPIEAGERILRGAVWWIDAAHSSASSQAVTNLGWGGSALAAQAGSSSGADSNDPKFLDWAGDNYVYLPGAAGNYLSVPDQAPLDITGDLDIRVQVALDDWTPSASQALLAKRATSGQTSYSLRVFTGGALELAWSPDGSAGAIIAKFSTANPTVTDGEALWVRATLDVDNGASGNDVKFYTSPDGATWTQLGSTVTTAGTTSVFASTSIVEVGTRATGVSDPVAGKVHRAVIRDSIGGSPVLDIDTGLIASGSAASFTARTGQTVTINRGTSGRKAVAVVHPVWLFGTDDYLETGDFAMLDFDAVTSLSLLVVARQWGTPPSGVDLLAKTAGGGAAGYALENGVGLPVRGIVTDGTDVAQTANITPTEGVLNVLSAVVDRSGEVLTVTSNGTAQTASTTDVGSLSNSEPLRVGYNTDAEIIAAAVFRRALTSDEVTALESYFASGDSATVKARLDVIEANDWVTSARIAANAVGSSELADNAVGSSELADNAVDTAAVADSAITTAKVAAGAVTYDKLARQPGNLLTENQASGTDYSADTTGFGSAYQCTLSSTTARSVQGSRSLRLTLTASSGGYATWTPLGTSGVPVTPGQAYTATAQAYATGTANSYIILRWYDSGGSFVSNVVSTISATTGAWVTHTVTAVAPATAAYASVAVAGGAGTSGDTVDWDAIGLWRGPGGQWQLPGVPVPGQGATYANGAVELPGGDYSPEGTVTANPGSTFLQTSGAATVTGMLSWRKATGTGSTGWVAEGALADTGWRNVTALMESAFKTSNPNFSLLLRRVGSRVTYACNETVAGSATGTVTIYNAPAGFRETVSSLPQYTDLANATTGGGTHETLALNPNTLYGFGWTAIRHVGHLTFDLKDGAAWPSSLPGSAA